jgi:hypothetical protein
MTPRSLYSLSIINATAANVTATHGWPVLAVIQSVAGFALFLVALHMERGDK